MGIESEPQFNPEEQSDENKKRLYDHCFEIKKFEEEDLIPVGGESIFSSEADIRVKGDFENFQAFFQEVHEMAEKYDLIELEKWLASQGIEVDEELFAKLFAFTKKFEEAYPENSKRPEEREQLYKEREKEITLSDLFDANIAECAEIAALAQMYLQQEDVESSYFSGDVLWNTNQEFSGEHSFIVIREGGEIYIYDPTNPTSTTQGTFPSIYITEVNFDEEMAKKQKRFVTAKNLLSKQVAFFGTNDGTNIIPEKHII